MPSVLRCLDLAFERELQNVFTLQTMFTIN